MDFFNKHRTIIFIAIGVVVVIGVWWSFSRETPSSSLITTQSASDVAVADRGLVDTLLQLRAVSLTGAIFSDPAFMNLRDFGTQIIPEPVGRSNPFAPIRFSPASSPDSSQGAQLFILQR